MRHPGILLRGVAAAMLFALVSCSTPNTGPSRPVRGAGSAATESPVSRTVPGRSPLQTSVALPARFRGTVSPLPRDVAARMRRTTWHTGCPVPLSDLRYLTLRYWGFDGRVHQGPMVVNASVAQDVVSVFRALFRVRFSIKEMHLTDRYVPGHEDPNDRRDYTAGFNCRPVVTAHGPRASWSQHAYGLAIDINPIENPYVASDGYIRNYHARRYRDRSLHLRGMIHASDAVVRAFAAIGWQWGGYWSGDKDYMHFSFTGR